jgi:dTDP-4-amino-4,6-dideoxygalactose transaminase
VIPFNKPYMTGRELGYIEQAHSAGQLAGDGYFTSQCHAHLEAMTGCRKAMLTHSCTAALEMAAMLLDIQPGDEVIMPSFTFVSTANAFVLRGGVPVFVDIRSDTFNIDDRLIEGAITARTKAICVVHYAGVACEMDSIMDIAARHGLMVVEDAAQGIMGSYKGRPLGSIGHLAAFSFHETKNVTCGEGGALLVNDPRFVERAEIIREKGTNRSRFFRGQVDKYRWVDLGSSYLPSEVNAAFLLAQLEDARSITRRRMAIWSAYQAWFRGRAGQGLRSPEIPSHCEHNAHMYQVLLHDSDERARFIEALRARGVQAVFHYVPLHSSPGGRRYGRSHGELAVTDHVSDRIVRMPLWLGIEEKLAEIFQAVEVALPPSAVACS